uniref:Uncharacterized protein n=1 Tax=Anguilla anguilla TaxID=7936 RepID=A0A0E9WDW5_ANGAN
MLIAKRKDKIITPSSQKVLPLMTPQSVRADRRVSHYTIETQAFDLQRWETT